MADVVIGTPEETRDATANFRTKRMGPAYQSRFRLEKDWIACADCGKVTHLVWEYGQWRCPDHARVAFVQPVADEGGA